MSKPTPSSVTKKTASARSTWLSAGVLVAAFIVFIGVVFTMHTQATQLRVNGQTYTLSVADTDAERTKGLGDRASMASNVGMLFVFSAPGRQCFWMKDMHFSLDMIWADSNKRVVQVAKDLSPATYPNVYCANNAQYVIELNAGQAAKAHIADGTVLNF